MSDGLAVISANSRPKRLLCSGQDPGGKRQVKPGGLRPCILWSVTGLFHGSCPTKATPADKSCCFDTRTCQRPVLLPFSSSCIHRLADITTELMQVILEANALRDKFLCAQPVSQLSMRTVVFSPKSFAYNQISARISC